MTILCEKCSGSGVVAISSKNCRYVAPGPVPEGAKGVTESTCFECRGKGTIARDHAHSGPNDINVLKAEPLERPLANFNVFDAVKLTARQARISRNEMRVYPVIKADVMARTRREHDLTTAIERTQLPHETTIHERIMPYRVRE